MTQEETINLVAKPAADYAADAVQYAYDNLELCKSRVDEMIQSEARKIVHGLFDLYAQETGKKYIDTLEGKYHDHYINQIAKITLENHDLHDHYINQIAKITLENHDLKNSGYTGLTNLNTRARREVSRYKAYEETRLEQNEEFIKSVSVNYINTKEDVLNSFGVPMPINDVKIEETEESDMSYFRKSKLEPMAFHKHDSDVTDYRRYADGETPFEKLFTRVYF